MILGIFKQGLHIILFTLTGDRALNPNTVQLVATDAMGFATSVPMSMGASILEFIGTWDTSARALGTAEVNASADDLEGHLATASGEVVLKSSYGRNYGEAYGDGL